MKVFDLGNICLIIGFLLLLVGFWGLFSQKNIIKIIVAFNIFDIGINLIIVSLGYINGRTAPIIDNAVAQLERHNVVNAIVDPVPQALVLTSIVIGFGVTALMLAYAMKLFLAKKTLDINNFNDLKW
jgi:multicomponent Na+:H+ antiporter subunit C